MVVPQGGYLKEKAGPGLGIKNERVARAKANKGRETNAMHKC